MDECIKDDTRIRGFVSNVRYGILFVMVRVMTSNVFVSQHTVGRNWICIRLILTSHCNTYDPVTYFVGYANYCADSLLNSLEINAQHTVQMANDLDGKYQPQTVNESYI
eukprot:1074529_1